MDITPIKSYFLQNNKDRLTSITSEINDELDWLVVQNDPKAVVAFSFALVIKDNLWDQADVVVAAVVTLGDKPENRVSELFNSGKSSKVYNCGFLALIIREKGIIRITRTNLLIYSSYVSSTAEI